MTDDKRITRHLDQLKNANRLLGKNDETPPVRDNHPSTSDGCDILAPKPGVDHLVTDPLEIHHPAPEGAYGLDSQEADRATEPQLEEGQGHQHQPFDDPRIPPRHLSD